MSTVSESRFSVYPSLLGLHAKAFNFVKKTINPSRVQAIEFAATGIGTFLSMSSLCRAFSFNPATSLLSGVVSYYTGITQLRNFLSSL